MSDYISRDEIEHKILRCAAENDMIHIGMIRKIIPEDVQQTRIHRIIESLTKFGQLEFVEKNYGRYSSQGRPCYCSFYRIKGDLRVKVECDLNMTLNLIECEKFLKEIENTVGIPLGHEQFTFDPRTVILSGLTKAQAERFDIIVKTHRYEFEGVKWAYTLDGIAI